MDPINIKEIHAMLKRKHGSKTLLFFRVKDCLKVYFDDAVLASSILGLVLESKITCSSYPYFVASFPVVKQEEYINRLVTFGYAIHVIQMCSENQDFNSFAK